MKRTLLLMPVLACSLALAVSVGVSTSTRSEAVNADSSAATTATLQTVLKKAWNNSNVADYDVVKVYVGHGTLSTSPTPGYAPMTKNDSLEGDFNDSGAYIDWGGQQFHSYEDDRVLIKVRLEKATTITVTGLENPAGWMDQEKDNCVINYFTITGSDIVNGNWYSPSKTVDMITGKTVASDMNYEVSLGAGDTFVMEWGRQFGERNWQNAGTGVQFTFTPAAVASKKTIYYGEMVSAVASAGDDVTCEAPIASYGFYHGNLSTGSPVKMTSDGENHLVGGDVETANWRGTFKNNDSLIIKIVASEHMVLHVSRAEKGDEFLLNCYLRYWVNTTKVMDKKFNSEPDASVFDAYIVLNANDTFYFEVGFEWENERNISMKDKGDIQKSLPQFDCFGTLYSDFAVAADSTATTIKDTIVCYGGSQTPTLSGHTWEELGQMFTGLDAKAKSLLSQGTYNIVSGSAVATNGTSQEVANAVAKYDQLVTKYSYSDFMLRNPVEASQANQSLVNNESSTALTVMVIIVATALAASVGICLIRKRKLVK